MTSSIFSSEVPALLQTHFAQLHGGSGIAIEIIKERGYWSAMGRKELADIGFSKSQQRTPALIVPLFTPDGSPAGCQTRPDVPRTDKKGRGIKYEHPKGGTVHIDVPPSCRQQIKDPSIRLWWTEGAKKADAAASRGLCCVNLSGVWGFKGKNIFGGVTVSADLDYIPLDGRECVIAYDSDIIDKAEVHQAMERLAEHLIRKGAEVYIVRLPSGDDRKKVGLDDYLLTNSADDLLDLRQAFDADVPTQRAYDCRDAGLGYIDEKGEWRPIIPVPTSILSMESNAEGEAGAVYTLLVQTEDANRQLQLTANEMADPRSLRAAFLAVGVALVPRREQLVASALLATSGDYQRIRLYHRTGWARGAYLAPGHEPKGVTVDLPRRVCVRLSGGRLPDAQQAMISLLSCMDREKTSVIASHLFVAPLARPAGLDRYKYALHLTGRTGTLKTSVACAFMALYAGEDHELQPILKWGEGATNNAIIAHAAYLADSVILVDNFKPSTGGGTKAFIGLIHNIVEGAEKERLTRTSQLRQSRELHAWLLTTGEDVPTEDAASMVRMLVLPFDWPGGHNPELAQAQARAPHMTALMRAWIAWIKAHDSDVKVLGKTLESRRDQWAQWLMEHRPKTVNILRLASNLSVQEIVWEAMKLCHETSFIAEMCGDAHARGLESIALAMGAASSEALEANVWLGALMDNLAGGAVYLRSRNGDDPLTQPRPNAQSIGWFDRDFFYLNPTLSHRIIRETLRQGGVPLGVSNTTLYKQLESLGVLVHSTDRLTTVIRVGDDTHRVVQIYRNKLDTQEDDDGYVDGYDFDEL